VAVFLPCLVIGFFMRARGPMGPEELTTYEWIGLGDGHIRDA
jgi:gamma-glutamyl phosphate reductase